MAKKIISLGDRTLFVKYPKQAAGIIDFSFPDLQEEPTKDVSTTLEIQYDEHKNLFSVKDSDKEVGSNLDHTDLALLLLARCTYSLSHGISSGMVIQGAAVQRNNNAIVMIGSRGTGKSILTAWLLSKGYAYLTDDLVYFPDDADCLQTFTKPLQIKPSGLPRVEEFARLQNKEDLFLQNKTGTLMSHRIFGDIPIQSSTKSSLHLFIEYNSNTTLSLDTLSPAQAAQRLMSCVVNGRNLKLNGLHQVALLTRQIPAMTLQYGDLDQLENVLEPIIDFVLDTKCNPSSLQKFVKAFYLLTTGKQTAITGTQKHEKASPIQEATPKGKKRKLTIGMATYDDYDGVYFSVQAIRMYHPEVTADTEILVVDNHPDGPCSQSLKKLDQAIDGYRYIPLQDVQGTGPARDCIFHNATGDFVLCIDCHVFIVPGAIKKLLDYLSENPQCIDLLQGPLIADNMVKLSTHFNHTWRKGMYGTWGHDERGNDPAGDPFEIPMQGVGLFGCRKEAWPGFNPRFRGFGADEGYIHEKFRQAGGRTLCLPFLRWVHRFERPMGAPYPIQWKDRIHNYLVGFKELGLDVAQVKEHFIELLGEETAKAIYKEVEDEMASPFHYFDAIYFLTLITESGRLQNIEKRADDIGCNTREEYDKSI